MNGMEGTWSGLWMVQSPGIQRCFPGCGAPVVHPLCWIPSPCVCTGAYGPPCTGAAGGAGGGEGGDIEDLSASGRRGRRS
jgi:hypothetical protein